MKPLNIYAIQAIELIAEIPDHCLSIDMRVARLIGQEYLEGKATRAHVELIAGWPVRTDFHEAAVGHAMRALGAAVYVREMNCNADATRGLLNFCRKEYNRARRLLK